MYDIVGDKCYIVSDDGSFHASHGPQKCCCKRKKISVLQRQKDGGQFFYFH